MANRVLGRMSAKRHLPPITANPVVFLRASP